MIKLSYGIRDGKIVHIDEIGADSRGEKCNCICPVCHKELVAKLGEVRQHHFAHKANYVCNDLKAQQTALHLLAKEIIKESNEIALPGWSISIDEIVGDERGTIIALEDENELPAYPEGIYKYDTVEIEKRLEGIVADAFIHIDNKPCIIEIAVTNFVDEEKKKKAEKHNIAMIEIDLSRLVKEKHTKGDVTEAVLRDNDNREWIYNPKRMRRLKEKKAEFEKKKTEFDKIKKQRERDLQKSREKSKQAIIELRQTFLPENYKNALKKLRSDRQAECWLKKFRFSKNTLEQPFYIDIPITGEFVFGCDRRKWQGKLFDDYVYYGFGQPTTTFTVDSIQKSISENRLKLHVDKRMICDIHVNLNGIEQEISLPYDVVKRYFDYLEFIGFVSMCGRKGLSTRPKSLEAPDSETASILKEIIQSIDPYIPDPNWKIKRELLRRLPKNKLEAVLKWK
ncbi:MAG: hypothetical protein IKD89_00495 [Clostridia bacterium]|nr:hypothetical protein [Clostridia bacterium]